MESSRQPRRGDDLPCCDVGEPLGRCCGTDLRASSEATIPTRTSAIMDRPIGPERNDDGQEGRRGEEAAADDER